MSNDNPDRGCPPNHHDSKLRRAYAVLVVALRFKQACTELGVGRTKLLGVLSGRPDLCRRVGNRYVFDPEHIAALKVALDPRSRPSPSDLPLAPRASRGRASPDRSLSPQEAYERALALCDTLARRKRTGRRDKPR